MFPLWDKVIVPVLEASGARRVVEIGALRGQTTTKLLDVLGPEGEVHVVDPVPKFDPTEHERRFPGAYQFHRAASHDVLPDLPPMDAALIDGDHNWYTVYHELKMLAAASREAEVPLPLLIMHDVCWPYGRRDLYYAPDQIPEEFRQPYAKRGISVGRKGLRPKGGINSEHYNAHHEGGPRNGVMTALEDFAEGHDRPLRQTVLPIYFGLAFVAEEDRLATQPELERELARLESPGFRAELLGFAEWLRLRNLESSHRLVFALQGRNERAARRYLSLVKAELVREGASLERLDQLEGPLEAILAEEVEGDFVDCTGDGELAVFLRAFQVAHEARAETWVAREQDGASRRARHLDLGASVRSLHGESEDSEPGKVALLATGPEVADTLAALYDRVSAGGYVIADDYATRRRRKAIDRFRAKRRIVEPLERVGAGAFWRKLD